MNRKLAFRSIGFKPRFLACIMFISSLSGCATIPREVEEPGSPLNVEVPASKKEVKSLISFRKDIEDLRDDIKGLRKDIKKSGSTSKVNLVLFKDQLKTFGCGCLTGVVISGLTVFFTGLPTISK